MLRQLNLVSIASLYSLTHLRKGRAGMTRDSPLRGVRRCAGAACGVRRAVVCGGMSSVVCRHTYE